MELERIPYRDGYIYVDRSATLQEKDLVYKSLSDKKLHYLDDFGLFLHNNKSSGDGYLKVVAQSIANPEYIDGVPFVEVEEDCIMLSKQYAETNYGHTVETKGAVARGFVKGYKAAQAKQFTEEDLRFHATRFAHLCRLKGVVTNNDTINLFDSEYINSLKTKVVSIEIKMEIEDYKYTNSSNGSPIYAPKTYQKDGKTFLTVKKVNYAFL